MLNLYPHLARVLADGTLRVPTSSIADDGERWDGYCDISPDDKRYSAWIAATHAYDTFDHDTQSESVSASDRTCLVRVTHVPSGHSLEIEVPVGTATGAMEKKLRRELSLKIFPAYADA